MSLSHIATIIVDEFLPEQQRNYLFLNSQMDATYRAYSTKVPIYLHGCPKKVIMHCLTREEKARKKLSEDDILEADEDEGIFSVRGKSGNTYRVSFGKRSGIPSCTCQDWIRYRVPCKHFFLLFITQTKWGWNSLPSSYLQEPHLSCDKEALKSLNEESSEHIVPTPDINPELYHQNYKQPLPTKVCQNFIWVEETRVCFSHIMCTFCFPLKPSF